MFPPAPLNPEQLEIVERAATLAREKFPPRAARYDAEASFPFENYADLHKAGLLGLLVPREYGGLGADPVTYAVVLLELAKGDSATALTFNMHSTHIRTLILLGTEEQKRRYLGEIAREGKVLASITSEPGSTYRGKYVIRMRFIPRDGGYQVEGVKYFCSLADGADYYVTSGILQGKESAKEGMMTAMIPRTSPGIELVDRWDAVGMRGTTSHTLRFDTFVDDEAIIGEPGSLMDADVLNFALGYAAVYLGVGQAAFEYVVEQTKAKADHGSGSALESPLVQYGVGEMYTRIQAARALLWMAAQAKAENRPDAPLIVNQAKAFGAETGLWATERCIRLSGGRGILKSTPLERLHRDAMSGPVMPPANERVIEVSGKAAFGLPANAIEFQ
jgi:alkylation response protein AidB-like acyl-CoA dehydrogenase